MESYDEFIKRTKEKLEKSKEFEVMYELQKELNEFIESLRSIDKSNSEKWIKNYTLAMIQEVSELINEFNWKWWMNPKEINKNAVLEEVVDTIHFLLSAYIQMGIPPERIGSLRELWKRASLMKESEIIESLVTLLHTLTEIHLGRLEILKQSDVLWGPLLGVVKSMGFSYEDLFWTYIRKNYENRRRQLDKNFKGGSYYACKKS